MGPEAPFSAFIFHSTSQVSFLSLLLSVCVFFFNFYFNLGCSECTRLTKKHLSLRDIWRTWVILDPVSLQHLHSKPSPVSSSTVSLSSGAQTSVLSKPMGRPRWHQLVRWYLAAKGTWETCPFSPFHQTFLPVCIFLSREWISFDQPVPHCNKHPSAYVFNTQL